VFNLKLEETDLIEFKENLNDTFEKEVVAFLNTNGGTIYLGISDNGVVLGIKNTGDTLKKIADIISDKILPNSSNLVYPSVIDIDAKKVIKVEVKKGFSLYYIKRYGRSATGCYIRIGTQCRSMNEDEIENRYSLTASNKDLITIKKEVETQLMLRGITDKKLIEELTQICVNNYKLALDSGMNKKDSLNKAYFLLKETLNSYKSVEKQSMPSSYSLIVVVTSFISSLIVSMIGWFVADVLSIYGIIYPILFVLSLVMVVYTIFTFRKRNKFDLIIVIVLCLSILAIFIQCIMYFYRASTGNFYYSLDYDFPGILKFNRYVLVFMDPITYELTKTIVLFDPTLLVSFICLLAILLISRLKKRNNCLN